MSGAVVLREVCACGASLDFSGPSMNMPNLNGWRANHRHEMPTPTTPAATRAAHDGNEETEHG